MRRRIRYADEFTKTFRELTYGKQNLVETAIVNLLSTNDPTTISHHLGRKAYYCNWSHRVRGNLLIIYNISKRTITFLSTGTHAQAYRPRA